MKQNKGIFKKTHCTDSDYDRIIITNAAVSDFTGDTGVFRFDTQNTD